ncbi:MAG: helix-turn-helix transcriptional regulator [Campylobacterales bacterium]|nr:helix-turn-helix transcriptional regulator [Campylobacterales bacterium]MBN2831722.1 helix-turn-helix transcriptional regulator [Campylobacterales bacterium]
MQYLSLNNIINFNLDSQRSAIIQNSFPKEIGVDYMEHVCLQEDLFFMKTDYRFLQKTRIESKQNERKFVITFSLKGKGSYTNRDDAQVIPFQEGFTTISLLDETEGFRDFHTKELSQVRIILRENFLTRHLKESVQEKYLYNSSPHLNLVKFAPTAIASQWVIQEIFRSPYQGELASCYLQSKVLELLSFELSHLSDKESSKQSMLDAYDKERIYKAKEILLKSMQSPPSIGELAKLVHLNETKLKVGFKEIFQMSPYQVVLKYKMHSAKKMLESGDFNINEVASKTGYKYANNFTHAFLKEFGVLPKAFKIR